MSAGKNILIGSSILAGLAAAYYFLVYRKTQSNAVAATTNINNALNVASGTADVGGITLQNIQSSNWYLPNATQWKGSKFVSYDAATRTVRLDDASWSGYVLDADHITMTQIGTGAQNIVIRVKPYSTNLDYLNQNTWVSTNGTKLGAGGNKFISYDDTSKAFSVMIKRGFVQLPDTGHLIDGDHLGLESVLYIRQGSGLLNGFNKLLV